MRRLRERLYMVRGVFYGGASVGIATLLLTTPAHGWQHNYVMLAWTCACLAGALLAKKGGAK